MPIYWQWVRVQRQTREQRCSSTCMTRRVYPRATRASATACWSTARMRASNLVVPTVTNTVRAGRPPPPPLPPLMLLLGLVWWKAVGTG